MAQVFLGVSRNLKLRDFVPGDRTYWCVFKGTQRADPQDIILLYFPVGVSGSQNGISQIYRIVTFPQTGVSMDCDTRGMAHVEIELTANLANRITMKDLKAHPVLKAWGAVGRNMQATTFSVPDDVWQSLKELILRKNPSLDLSFVAPSIYREAE